MAKTIDDVLAVVESVRAEVRALHEEILAQARPLTVAERSARYRQNKKLQDGSSTQRQTAAAEMRAPEPVEEDRSVTEPLSVRHGVLRAKRHAVRDAGVTQFVTESDSPASSRSLSASSPSLALFSSSSVSPSLSSTLTEKQKIATHAKNACSPAKTAAVWNAYRTAYERRHGASPPDNAKQRGMLSRFIDRIPAAEAPQVAAFYVSHNDATYVRSMHAIGLLLRDAEKLHTEWVTGRQITATEARQTERTQAIGQVFLDLMEKPNVVPN